MWESTLRRTLTNLHFALKCLLSSLFLVRLLEVVFTGVITQFGFEGPVTRNQTSSGSHTVWHVETLGKVCCREEVLRPVEQTLLFSCRVILCLVSEAWEYYGIQWEISPHKGRALKRGSGVWFVLQPQKNTMCLGCCSSLADVFSDSEWVVFGDILIILLLLCSLCSKTRWRHDMGSLP